MLENWPETVMYNIRIHVYWSKLMCTEMSYFIHSMLGYGAVVQ